MASSPPSTEQTERTRARRLGSVRRRRAPACGAAALIWGALMALAPCARANMRAPEVRPRAPSSAAFPSSPAGAIEVLGETLRFDCGDDACDVEATYRLRARQAVAVD